MSPSPNGLFSKVSISVIASLLLFAGTGAWVGSNRLSVLETRVEERFGSIDSRFDRVESDIREIKMGVRQIDYPWNHDKTEIVTRLRSLEERMTRCEKHIDKTSKD